ncbi:MAG: chorismate synthase [Chloroflexota bacterium]
MEILGGPYFGIAGAGESHGPGITTIVFGCPPGLRLSRDDIQPYLNRRRPGSNRHGTPRNEKDKVLLLSGLYQDDHDALTAGPSLQFTLDEKTFQSASYETGFTTGEPISALVLSANTKSRHYEQFQGAEGAARPGHTDLLKHHKSKGFVDIRGGGRSSYRSTISDVIGGSIARHFLKNHFNTCFLSSITQVGPLKAGQNLSSHLSQLIQNQKNQQIDNETIQAIERQLQSNEIYAFDAEFAKQAGALIKKTRLDGDSIGAVVEVIAINPPALVGDPLYQSLKLQLMGLLGGLHAVQSVEVGDGKAVVERLGSQNNDPIRQSGYQQNSHGGLIGGMTTGMPLQFQVGFKPTSTINKTQQTVQKNLEEIDFTLDKGRHDPCVGVRAGVTLESRLAIGIMNAVLAHQAKRVDVDQFRLFK